MLVNKATVAIWPVLVLAVAVQHPCLCSTLQAKTIFSFRDSMASNIIRSLVYVAQKYLA
jgi:hypothetical protein